MNLSIHHSASITLLLLWDAVLLSLGKSTDSLATAPTVVKDVKEVKQSEFQYSSTSWPFCGMSVPPIVGLSHLEQINFSHTYYSETVALEWDRKEEES